MDEPDFWAVWTRDDDIVLSIWQTRAEAEAEIAGTTHLSVEPGHWGDLYAHE